MSDLFWSTDEQVERLRRSSEATAALGRLPSSAERHRVHWSQRLRWRDAPDVQWEDGNVGEGMPSLGPGPIRRVFLAAGLWVKLSGESENGSGVLAEWGAVRAAGAVAADRHAGAGRGWMTDG